MNIDNAGGFKPPTCAGGRDPGSDETHQNLKAPHGDIAASAKLVESRAQMIIERLTEGLGVDVWSVFIKDAAFGTRDWQPEHSINRTQNRQGFFKCLYARLAGYLKR